MKTPRVVGCSVTAAMTALLLVSALAVSAAVGDTTRVSVSSDGVEGNGGSLFPFLSADGRYVVFDSSASNLVPVDTNSLPDVFVRDTETGETSRVSVATDGSEASGQDASISADGRYVAFRSGAENLDDNDTNNSSDAFVHDSNTGETRRVSESSDGAEADRGALAPSISADGRFVAFNSLSTNLVDDDTNEISDVFIHDTQTGATTRVSVGSDGTEGNGNSFGPSISTDGRFITFLSGATNLVTGDTNGVNDVFLHDTQTGETTRVSVASDGTQADSFSFDPAISADGGHIAFHSFAANLVGNDTNSALDVFVHDTETGETIRVSVHSDGTEADGNSSVATISADGSKIAFFASATNLIDGDTNNTFDTFVHDTTSGETTRVSIDSDGTEADGFSAAAAISADGRFVAFHSGASNLVDDDTNGNTDVFVHHHSDPPPPDLSAEGRRVRGRHTVDLSWDGGTSTNIDVFRDGDLVDTVANTGSYTDAIGARGRATYTHQVCVTGTSSCSNETTTRFGGPPLR